MNAWHAQSKYAEAVGPSSNAGGDNGLNLVESTKSLLDASYHADKAKSDWAGRRRGSCP